MEEGDRKGGAVVGPPEADEDPWVFYIAQKEDLIESVLQVRLPISKSKGVNSVISCGPVELLYADLVLTRAGC